MSIAITSRGVDLEAFGPRLAIIKRQQRISVTLADADLDLSPRQAAQLGAAIMDEGRSFGLVMAQLGLGAILDELEAEA